MFTVEKLVESVHNNQTKVNGQWIPSRPIVGPFRSRLSDALQVLLGKADAVKWPMGQ